MPFAEVGKKVVQAVLEQLGFRHSMFEGGRIK